MVGIKPLTVAVLLAAGALAEVRVTYLANEGILLEAKGRKILIDALFRDSLGSYARHPPEVQENLETGAVPFDGVHVALATHYHLDHWDAGAISRFLRSNPASLFIAPAPATAMMPSSQLSRTRPLDPVAGRTDNPSDGIEAFRLTHRQVPHVGYAVTIGGLRVFHLGDADTSAGNYAELTRLGQADVALVPFWWLLDSGSIAFLRDTWKPRHLVAIHFGAGDLKSVAPVEAAWKGAWTCTRRGETRTY